MKKAKKDTRRIVTHTVTIEFKSCGALRLTNRELRGIVRVFTDMHVYHRNKVPSLGEGCCGDFAVITSVASKKD